MLTARDMLTGRNMLTRRSGYSPVELNRFAVVSLPLLVESAIALGWRLWHAEKPLSVSW
jgi:hypothetical protein